VLEPNEVGLVEVTVDTNRFVGSKTVTLYLTMEQFGSTEQFRFIITTNSVDGIQIGRF